jgi:hypothetical protein
MKVTEEARKLVMPFITYIDGGGLHQETVRKLCTFSLFQVEKLKGQNVDAAVYYSNDHTVSNKSTKNFEKSRQRRVDITHQRPRNMDLANPPPAKPCAECDEARSSAMRLVTPRTRARTWNIILLHIQDTLPSASRQRGRRGRFAACSDAPRQ